MKVIKIHIIHIELEGLQENTWACTHCTHQNCEERNLSPFRLFFTIIHGVVSVRSMRYFSNPHDCGFISVIQ